MRCPFCASENLSVIETRALPAENALRRRRACTDCAKRFTSYERIEAEELRVIKKDGARERYDREKVRKGMLIALYKRPVAPDLVEEAVDRVERSIRTCDAPEVKSTEIGKLVMRELRKLDKVAYVRFASIYKDFAGLEEFVREIKSVSPKALTIKRRDE
jgi:transcriptional repressor NrdR